MSLRSFTNPRFQKEANLRTFLARMSLFEFSAKFISVKKLETVGLRLKSLNCVRNKTRRLLGPKVNGLYRDLS